MQEIKEELREESLVAAFPDREAAVAAATALDAAGIPPDHVGVVAGNVRQAREAAGSFSAAGAIVAALAVLLIPGRSRVPRAEMQPAAASA